MKLLVMSAFRELYDGHVVKPIDKNKLLQTLWRLGLIE